MNWCRRWWCILVHKRHAGRVKACGFIDENNSVDSTNRVIGVKHRIGECMHTNFSYYAMRAINPRICSLVPLSQSSQQIASIAVCLPGPSPSSGATALLSFSNGSGLCHLVTSDQSRTQDDTNLITPSILNPRRSAARTLGALLACACHCTLRTPNPVLSRAYCTTSPTACVLTWVR